MLICRSTRSGVLPHHPSRRSPRQLISSRRANLKWRRWKSIEERRRSKTFTYVICPVGLRRAFYRSERKGTKEHTSPRSNWTRQNTSLCVSPRCSCPTFATEKTSNFRFVSLFLAKRKTCLNGLISECIINSNLHNSQDLTPALFIQRCRHAWCKYCIVPKQRQGEINGSSFVPSQWQIRQMSGESLVFELVEENERFRRDVSSVVKRGSWTNVCSSSCFGTCRSSRSSSGEVKRDESPNMFFTFDSFRLSVESTLEVITVSLFKRQTHDDEKSIVRILRSFTWINDENSSLWVNWKDKQMTRLAACPTISAIFSRKILGNDLSLSRLVNRLAKIIRTHRLSRHWWERHHFILSFNVEPLLASSTSLNKRPTTSFESMSSLRE